MNIAPFKVCIVQISDKDEKQKEVANNLYNTLNSMGIDTLLDDRNERPGVKFNDMDLIGIPLRITVGKKVSENEVELKQRNSENVEVVNIDNIIDTIKEIIKKEEK